MVNSIGYTQSHYQEKQYTEAGKLGSHWKLRDQSNIIRDDGNFVEANTWSPLLRNNDVERSLHNQRSHCKTDITSN